MGSVHIQTSGGNLVYNVPYTDTRYSTERLKKDEIRQGKSRKFGSIIKEQDDKRVIAEGAWLDPRTDGYDVSLGAAYLEDQTGSAMVQGNFFADDMEFEHFAVGAPKANKLTGRVYVCYKCFYPKSERKDGKDKNPSFQVELEASKKQTGERFGAAVAAVDLDGDGIDELVIGAPLYSSKVSMKITYFPECKPWIKICLDTFCCSLPS